MMYEFVVVARLNAPLQPLDRAAFEDPLVAFYAESKLGEVVGGGTQLGDDCIEYCEIEIALLDRAGVAALVAKLNEIGAPKGSRLFLPGGEGELAFGEKEGLALRLNGVDLPDDVYANSDVDHVIAELEQLTAPDGRYLAYYEGDRETSLFVYGNSFDAMKLAIAPLVDTYPLCQKSRVERVA